MRSLHPISCMYDHSISSYLWPYRRTLSPISSEYDYSMSSYLCYVCMMTVYHPISGHIREPYMAYLMYVCSQYIILSRAIYVRTLSHISSEYDYSMSSYLCSTKKPIDALCKKHRCSLHTHRCSLQKTP